MDRVEFAKRLHSVTVPSGTSEDEIRQIDAFLNDTIYAVTADKFNDDIMLISNSY